LSFGFTNYGNEDSDASKVVVDLSDETGHLYFWVGEISQSACEIEKGATSCAPGPPGNCTITVVCELGVTVSDDSWQATISVNSNKPGEVKAEGSVFPDGLVVDPNGSNNSFEDVFPVSLQP
jgi:hypothetical protein